MDKNYTLLKTEAIKLRKDGSSYNDITEKLGVAKSTLSYWLKSVHLKPEYRKRFYTNRIQNLTRGPQSQKERRAREIKKIIGQSENEIRTPLSFDAYRLMGAALYWAEGSKGNSFEITNSDPYLILFFVRWVETVFNIPAKNLKARLNIYPQQNDLKIKKFWSDLTSVPLGNFGKTYVKPLSKGYKKNNLYYGTIKIYVPKSTDRKHMVFGWINKALKDVDPKVKFVEKKWQSLTKTSRPANLNK
ncbi:helix-turn-helix domain-containing protein [Patescibacteria group bacterium]|nr:helix-turn-helix domain-containing protein [Patescibacteria group bacterium]